MAVEILSEHPEREARRLLERLVHGAVDRETFYTECQFRIGHVLEVHDEHGRFAYGWIADVDDRRFVLAAAPDAFAAMAAASRALEVCRPLSSPASRPSGGTGSDEHSGDVESNRRRAVGEQR